MKQLEEAEKIVITQIRERIVLLDQDFSSDADLFEAGLDSMGIMQLLLVIEEQFGILLSPVDLTRDNFQTAQKIATLVRNRQEQD